MTSYEIEILFNQAKRQIEDLSEFIKSFAEIGSVIEIIKNRTSKIGGGKDVNPNAANLHGEINAAVNLVTKRSPKAFFKDFSELRKILENLNFPENPVGTVASDLSISLTNLEDLYDAFIVQQNGENVTPLIFAANVFSTRLQDVINYLSIISIRDQSQTQDFQQASLFFPNVLGLNELIQKLQSLKEIYTESCQILSISESDFPLQILRLETGSWYVELAGYPKVIDLILDGIRVAAKQLFQCHTRAGRLEAMPTRVENLEALLELQKKMQAAGLDTDAMKDQLSKSGAVLSKQLMMLLSNEDSVTINEEKIIIDGNFEKKLIGGSSKKLIENTLSYYTRIEPHLDDDSSTKLIQ